MGQTAIINGGIPPLRENNKLKAEDVCVHDWYRFILSFPPHLVRDYLSKFGITEGQVVLDPFCGTGTTLVECKKLGIESVGIEANPLPCFATGVKIDWSARPDDLLNHSEEVADIATAALKQDGLVEHLDLPLFEGHGL